MEGLNQYFEANQRLWDNKTKFHVESAFYDMEAFLAGKTSLRKIELAELGDLKEKKLLHTQCHFGQDTLSMQRMGAHCTGMDFSKKAIEQARDLNKQLGLDAQFICCNLLDLDQHLKEIFDVVYTSYGVITWMPDLNLWAQQIASRLKPGGIFHMIEFHPVLYMFDWEKNSLEYNYFNPGPPNKEVEEGTYADKKAKIKMEEYFWTHSLGDVLDSLLKVGLEILSFNEYDYSPYNIFDGCLHRTEQEFVFEHNKLSIPHVFSIKAVKK